MIHMPVYHTQVHPSQQLYSFLGEISFIAALAKTLGLTSLYNQAKEIHDKQVLEYRARTAPKKKGFWEQFKDNLTFRDMDTYTAASLDLLEEGSSFPMICRLLSQRPIYEVQSTLKDSLDKFNQKYGAGN